MVKVSIAQLKDQLSHYLRLVERGEEVEVTNRDRAVARIVPVREAEIVMRPPELPFSEIRDKKYPPVDLPVDIVELLLEDRRKR